ncbi:NAD(P)-dependent oxidoreductase [Marinivivus vitaminiproducens]|uniref:NAD(P)-dependent oxidoreductase n=1 Tax=Marinivivus vitaminiproducens TaxID=3035935 RepID=UPI00279D374F|nr:NAD(P)-dependent oxidoreductase [Geminicoccaceae bacterium SCSIO 64248]
MNQPRIGFIGVGLMGYGMARNLIEKGFPLTVMANRNRKPVEDLVGRGAKEAATPRDLAANVDVVILCVTSSAVVEQVVLGTDGIVESARPDLCVIDASTASPESTVMIADKLAEKGAVMLDAPLARTPKEALEGRLNTMVGGDEALFERMKPVFAAYCENIVYIGALGSGHKLKLINNYLSLCNAALVAEAVTVAEAAGVDLQKLNDVVSVGGANSGMFQMIMPRVLRGEPGGPQFTLSNAAKDLGYFQAMAEGVGRTPPVGAAARDVFASLVALGEKDRVVPELYDLMKAGA